MLTQPKPHVANCRPVLITGLGFSILGLLFTGCLSKPALKRQTYAFDTPSIASTATSKGGGVVAIRTVDVSALFDHPSFVYRTGPEAYEVDPFAGFLVAPKRAVDIAIRAWLRNSGRFQAVVEPGSQLAADKSLEVHVSELYGDFQKAGQGAAVFSLRILCFPTDKGTAQQVLLQKDYSRRLPLKQNTATALVAGWNQALAEIMAEAASDLSAAAMGQPAP